MSDTPDEQATSAERPIPGDVQENGGPPFSTYISYSPQLGRNRGSTSRQDPFESVVWSPYRQPRNHTPTELIIGSIRRKPARYDEFFDYIVGHGLQPQCPLYTIPDDMNPIDQCPCYVPLHESSLESGPEQVLLFGTGAVGQCKPGKSNSKAGSSNSKYGVHASNFCTNSAEAGGSMSLVYGPISKEASGSSRRSGARKNLNSSFAEVVEKMRKTTSLSGASAAANDNGEEWCIEILSIWLEKHNMERDLTKLSIKDLSRVLPYFYESILKKGSPAHAYTFLTSLRENLNKYLQRNYPQTLDIIQGEDFRRANEVLSKFFLPRYYGQYTGEDVVIDVEDQKLLGKCNAFGLDHPKTLLNKVFLDLMAYFGHQTAIPQHEWTCDNLVYMFDEGSKLHYFVWQEKLHFAECRMYELPGNPECPVASLKKYLGKTTMSTDALFQVSSSVTDEISAWYGPASISERKMSLIMPKISRRALLGKEYSNNSIIRSYAGRTPWKNRYTPLLSSLPPGNSLPGKLSIPKNVFEIVFPDDIAAHAAATLSKQKKKKQHGKKRNKHRA